MGNSITQLRMFQSDDDEPLQPVPLQVSKQYHFPLQHHVTSDDTIFYSVQDWISGVAKTDNPAQFWRELKKRLKKANVELSTSCLQLPYRVANGRTYQMDFASDVTLYQIAQRMDANTGIRNDVLEYLAKAGAYVDLLRQDPEGAREAITVHRQTNALASGKTEAWITARELGIQARNHCTAAIVKSNPNTNIAETTNTTYRNVLGQDASGLRQTLGLGPRQNPRDNLSLVALSYLQVTEASIATTLEGFADDDVVPIETVRKVVAIVSKATGTQAKEMAQIIGVDLITGKKLIGRGS